jgi:hypothetical protein
MREQCDVLNTYNSTLPVRSLKNIISKKQTIIVMDIISQRAVQRNPRMQVSQLRQKKT